MLTVRDFIKASQGRLIRQGPECFNGVSTDSRTIQQGELFVALKGENFDGHRFYKEAMQKGGGAVINHDALCAEDALPIANYDCKGTLLSVDNTLLSLHRVAGYIRSEFKGPVIGVVGSNGKTTTKELAFSVLSKRFKTLKTPGNNNNHIGLPRAMTFIDKDTECLILEMGTNRPGDIKTLCEIANPDYAIVTNIGYEHLEGFGDLKGVRDAELEILPFAKTLIVNTDDHFLIEGLKGKEQKRLVGYGIYNSQCPVSAKGINHTERGVDFILSIEGKEIKISTSLRGIVNVYNSLAAAAMGFVLNLSLEEIKGGLESFKGAPMRLELIQIKGITILNDCYNANPSSMQDAITELRRLSKGAGRTIAVLGDMFEIGESAIERHKNIGTMLNQQGIDILIGTGTMMDNALNVFKGTATAAADSLKAAEELLKIIKPGDVVLIKGSRAMKMERVTEAIKNAL